MTIDEKLDEDLYRAQNKFWEAAMDGAYRVMDEAPGLWKGPDSKYYRTEKRIIMKHVDPFYTGVFVTAFLFVTFRVSGSRWFAKIRETYSKGAQSSGRNLSMKQNAEKQETKEWKSFLERKAEEKQKIQSDLFQLPIDILLSLACGGSSILWLSKPKELRKDFSEIPLVSGRSVVHKYACGHMEKAFQEIEEEILNRAKDDTTLKTFHTFIQNCRIRSDFIRSREADGADLPDVIPYPGLRGIEMER